MLSPLCVAVRAQVPTLKAVTVEAEIEQMALLLEATVTVSPLDALTEIENESP